MPSDVENSQSAGPDLDLFSASDEEIMNLNPADMEYQEESGEEEDPEEDTSQGEEQGAADDAGDPSDEGVESDDDADTEEEDGDPDEADTGEASDDEDGDSDEDEDAEESDAEEESDEDSDDGIDYKAEYQKLLAPFKANGKELQVKDVDEAIQLMQMGANYNKKMAALKPNLKMLKLLENHQLLDESKLNYLIDLDRKDPKAINKLVKEAGIDPMEMDPEKSGEYRPQQRTVDDREVELDHVLDELQDSPHYSKTVDLVSKQWDSSSRQTVANNPQLLKVLNDHMDRGVYNVIVEELDRQRTFGNLQGLSDLEAYKQVGDSLQANGGFDHLVSGKKDTSPGKNQGQQDTPQRKRVAPKRTAEDPKLKRKKRAASPTKKAASSKDTTADYNPLGMSDEAFEQQFSSKLL